LEIDTKLEMFCLKINDDFEEIIIIEQNFNVIDLNYPANMRNVDQEVAQEDARGVAEEDARGVAEEDAQENIYGNAYYADDGLYDNYVPYPAE
jgi:hypothetical protein